MTYSIHVLPKLCVESVTDQFCVRARAQDIFPHERGSHALRNLNRSRHGKIESYHSDYHWFGAGIAQPVWWLVLGLDDLKSPDGLGGPTRSSVDGWRECFPRKTVKLIDHVHLLLRLRMHGVVPPRACLRPYGYFTVYEARVSDDISDVTV